MGNAVFSWVNLVDTAALSAPYAAATLPVSNLANPSVGIPWRALGSTNTYFDVDFQTASAVQLLALAGLQIGSSDEIKHELSAVSAGANELYDSGWVSGVDGGYRTHFTYLANAVNARYWRCSINAVSLTSQGYFDVGRAWAGPAYQLARNYGYGLEDDIEDTSVVTRAPKSGTVYIDENPIYRYMGFPLANMQATDEAQIRAMIRAVGYTKQLIFIPNPDSAAIHTKGILGRRIKTAGLSQTAYDVFVKPLMIEESI